jgi:hypothetical protein
MAADWRKLENDWKDHDIALVAEVDCTAHHNQEFCEDYEVQVRTPGLRQLFSFVLCVFWREVLAPVECDVV